MSSSSRPRRTLGISLKLYFTPSQTLTYYRSLTELVTLANSHNIQLFLIPSLLTLPILLGVSIISLGAQDCSPYDSGAYTGEISPLELSALGCTIVELGHAERRGLFGETDESVAKKAEAVFRNGMIPLICIGEQESSSVENAVRECTPQITSILDIPNGKGKEVIFAYEPVWAIGQPKPASAEYVVEVTKALKKVCEDSGKKDGVRIIYGGSAGPGTFGDMKEGVDGLFLGRFGHDVESVRGVIEELAR